MTSIRSFASTEPYRSFFFLLQVILLTGFSITPQAAAKGTQKQAAGTEPPSAFSASLNVVGMKAYQLQTTLSLAAKSAISKLNPPSEFSRLKSQFEEPLIATGSTSSKEEAELFKALKVYRDRPVEDDFSSLTSFLHDHRSSWRVALLANIGLLDYHYGYFSRAINSWSQAWREGKSVADPKSKPLVDRALGELARMHARLGHAEELEALLKELGDRPVSGPATEAITGAREGLAIMHTEPGIAYLCGPMALKNLLLSSEHYSYNQVEFLDKVRSGPHGVTLSQVSQLADQAKLPHRVVFRTPSQPIPVPSIIHWKVSHFAALIGDDGKRFHIIDPTFGTDLWITRAAIDAESDGYFLVPERDKQLAWREATGAETAHVRGMGYPQSSEPGATTPGDINADDPPSGDCGCQQNPAPMAKYNFTEMLVNLHITDTPVGYMPPKGPSVKVTLNYNQREAYQPAAFSYFNVGQKWTLNWLSYIEDDPRSAGANVSRYVAGGGDISYSGYNASTGVFTAETRNASVLSRSTTGVIVYKRTLADGSVETYGASNGATTYPRLVFLTQRTDPAGNSVMLSYDNQQRLTSITDATGRLTTLSYGLSVSPLLVTQITDPFGRSAQLAYDSTGRLIQITDILGIKSQFAYDSSSLINAMTTPYGTTTFTYGQNGTYRYLTATDPLGHTERLEWYQPAPSGSNLPFSEPATLVPAGILNPFNEYITGRDTFYWDKHAYAVAAGNYAMARIRHWMHNENNTNEMYHALESYKYPLENRIWFNYPNQSSTGFSGSLDYRTRIGRVQDDGTTQLSQTTRNSLGYVTDLIDPIGRETQFIYATNGIDLLTVKQKTSVTSFSTTAQFTYNPQHLPLTYTDAAGQTQQFQYNAAGQLTQRTDALGETTSYLYDSLGYLISVINANGVVQMSFTYDQYERIATATDSEGYTVAYTYDAADRVTQETFPDTTTRKYNWTNLDLTAVMDRQGNTTQYSYDSVRNVTSTTDPLNRITRLGYYENKSLKNVTDPNGNTTTWNIDVQSRATSKQYADGSQATNGYETTTSRLKSITDALGQVKTFTYAKDDTLIGIAYTKTVNPTPNVSFAYDSYFRRITSMTDGNGVRQYTYQPIGSLGALELVKESGPYQNDFITYQYDALSRLIARNVDTSGETFAYDALSRLTKHGTALGTFNLGYLGQTGQITSQQISTGTVATTWRYDTNTNDRRLQAITNSGSTRSFDLTTTQENLVTQIQEAALATSAFPPKTWTYGYDSAYRLTQASSSTAAFEYGLDSADNITVFQSPSGVIDSSYNNLNQISVYGSQPYVYDKSGNVLDDGLRTYAWDGENRMLSITSKVNISQKTTFRYDGLGRRTSANTGSNALTTETRYLWCGDALCQARTSADVVSRRYYAEGEYLPLGGSSLYYSQDHLGSVRDVLAAQSGTRVAAFDYDPYGYPSQSTGRISTDFRYAGLFFDQQDGLYLSEHRVYDPKAGRWLSRDPLGVSGGVNTYSYASGNPSNAVDPRGLWSTGYDWDHGYEWIVYSSGHEYPTDQGWPTLLTSSSQPLYNCFGFVLSGGNPTLGIEPFVADNILRNEFDEVQGGCPIEPGDVIAYRTGAGGLNHVQLVVSNPLGATPSDLSLPISTGIRIDTRDGQPGRGNNPMNPLINVPINRNEGAGGDPMAGGTPTVYRLRSGDCSQ